MNLDKFKAAVKEYMELVRREVAAEEREACARIAESFGHTFSPDANPTYRGIAFDIARRIRERRVS